MRVAIFSDSFSPVVNGVAVSINALIDELRARGHSAHIFTTGFRGYKDPDPNVYRFPSVGLPLFPGYPLAIPPFYFALRNFRKHQFDIIHTHTPYTVGFVGLRWAESHEIPIVSTYHTLYDRYAHYVPYMPKVYTRYKIAKHTNYYYNRCRHVIAPSEPAAQALRRHSVRTPVTIIPTGNPELRDMSKDEARKQIGARPGDRILLYVGRVAKEKNIPLLVEAVAQVLLASPNLRFFMVGDGPFRKQAQQMARDFGVGDQVRFAGAVARSEVDKYYLASDLFVFASTTETQGLVVGEAMTYGLPTVAVHGGGASASIRDGSNGFIVGNSAGALAEKIDEVMSNGVLRAQLSACARASVKSWTHSDSCDQVLRVYEEVLGK